LRAPCPEWGGRSGRCGVQSAGLPGASSGVRRGPLTGANIGMRLVAVAGSKTKGAAASARPEGLGTWTGLPDWEGERAMNGR
jgi:hypothetical protein